MHEELVACHTGGHIIVYPSYRTRSCGDDHCSNGHRSTCAMVSICDVQEAICMLLLWFPQSALLELLLQQRVLWSMTVGGCLGQGMYFYRVVDVCCLVCQLSDWWRFVHTVLCWAQYTRMHESILRGGCRCHRKHGPMQLLICWLWQPTQTQDSG